MHYILSRCLGDIYAFHLYMGIRYTYIVLLRLILHIANLHSCINKLRTNVIYMW